MADRPSALVIGSGPAGLMAAERLCARGVAVTVAEAKPAPARKFLMAGRSGLNLTKAEPEATFGAAYREAAPWLRPMLAAFGPEAVADWAKGLGQEVFVGSSGRVFPRAMKASPLLRAWLARLAAGQVRLATGWRWTGWDSEGAWRFEAGPRATSFGSRGSADGSAGVAELARYGAEASASSSARTFAVRPDVTVLALGGASWARLGSDGAWAELLAAREVDVAPFRPANMGLKVEWSAAMGPRFGTPVKNVALRAGTERVRAEFVISARGLEGGGIYAISRAVREGAALRLDLAPDLGLEELARRLARRRKGDTLANSLRKAARLGAGEVALLMEFGRPLPAEPARLAGLVKDLPVRHAGPRPLDEAISVAGGVRAEALDAGLMLRALPGVFCAGEMLDWEAPTGGYLITGCLATGRWAGEAAADFLGV